MMIYLFREEDTRVHLRGYLHHSHSCEFYVRTHQVTTGKFEFYSNSCIVRYYHGRLWFRFGSLGCRHMGFGWTSNSGKGKEIYDTRTKLSETKSESKFVNFYLQWCSFLFLEFSKTISRTPHRSYKYNETRFHRD